MIEMKEVYRNTEYSTSPVSRATYKVREIFINPEHISHIRKNNTMKKKLVEGLLDSSRDVKFCTISLASTGFEFIVIGSIEEVREKLFGESRRVLHG